jgi:beta-glucosidase
VQVDCGIGCRGTVPVTHELAAAQPGQWRHLKIPLTCFAKAGADLSRVTAPFAVQTAGRLALSVANIQLESGTDGLMPCAD